MCGVLRSIKEGREYCGTSIVLYLILWGCRDTARPVKITEFQNFSLFHQYTLNTVLADIKDDLTEFGLSYTNWFSEQSLFEDGSIEKGIQALKDAGHTF